MDKRKPNVDSSLLVNIDPNANGVKNILATLMQRYGGNVFLHVSKRAKKQYLPDVPDAPVKIWR